MNNEQQTDGIFQVEEGKWGYRIKCKIHGEKVDIRKVRDLDGKPMTCRLHAKKARAMHFAQLEGEEKSKRKFNFKMTLEDVWNYYLSLELVEKGDKAPTTLQRQESLWRNHIGPTFGHRYVNDITIDELRQFLVTAYNVKGYSYAYVEGFLKLFWLLFGYADRLGYIEKSRYQEMFVTNNPNKLRMPEPRLDTLEKERQIEIYSDEQVQQLAYYFQGRFSRIAFMLGLYCGMRISEVFALTWDDFQSWKGCIHVNKQIAWDKKNKAWYITKTKTRNSVRTIPLPPILVCELDKERKRQDRLSQSNSLAWKNNARKIIIDRRIPSEPKKVMVENFINKSENGEMLTNNSLKYHAYNIKNLFGYPFHFHALRRTFITNCAKSGVDKQSLMKITGHSKYETISKYYEGITEDDKVKMDNVMNTWADKCCPMTERIPKLNDSYYYPEKHLNKGA